MAQTVELTILDNGIHCGGCESRIETALGRLPGVHKVKAGRKTQQVQLILDQGQTPLADVMKKLEYLGYRSTRSEGSVR